jgi:hypothetical protein
MSDWGLVLDASTSRVTREDFRRLKEMGVRGYIQCLQTGGFSSSQTAVRAVAQSNLLDALAEGLAVGGYLNSQPWRAPEVIHNDARAAAGSAWGALIFVANDVEIKDPQTGQVPSADQIRRSTQLIKAEGKRTAYYTASWYWRGVLGNPTWPWLLEDPLWNAYYDGDPDIDFWRAPYGPWTQAHVIGEQYQGTTNLGGDLFDLNFFDLDYLRPAAPQPPIEEEDMTPEQHARLVSVEQAIARIEAMVGWWKQNIDQQHRKEDGTLSPPSPRSAFNQAIWTLAALDRHRFAWLIGEGDPEIKNMGSKAAMRHLMATAVAAELDKRPAAPVTVNLTAAQIALAVTTAIKRPDVLKEIGKAVADEEHRRLEA